MLAGGSDLLVRMKGGFIEPDLVVDIKRIKAMREIKKTATGFRIGAAVPCAELGEHKALAKAWPGVVEAANLIGSTQVQGRAPSAAICATPRPAADSVPALVAAGAKAVIAGPQGQAQGAGRADPGRPGQDLAQEGRAGRGDSRCRRASRVRATPICASSRAPRWTSRWSAPAST